MSKDANVSQKLSPAVIISIGDHAEAVSRELETRYPTVTRSLPTLVDPQALSAAVTELVGAVSSSPAPLEGHMELPGLLVISDTADHATVLTALEQVRAAHTTVKPRVWPTFTSGDPVDLAEFDEQLTTRGSGICDLVLVLTGAKSAAEQANALSAWLHVKMPAPASVLAELPDASGRICRYVALGATVVSPESPDVLPSGEGTTVDHGADPKAGVSTINAAQAIATVTQRLTAAASEDATVTVARDAASALIAAAEDYDAPALLRAETNLTSALNDLDRRLVPHLESALPRITREVVSQAATAPEPESKRASSSDADVSKETSVEEAPASPAVPNPADPAVPTDATRTQTVSELVLLASKGGLSKMFSRNRMATVAQSLEPVARRDVQAATAQALDHVAAQIPTLVAREADVVSQAIEERQAQRLLEAQTRKEQLWGQALAAGRNSVNLWPTVSTAGITRAWGGAVPAPRQYVVGSASALEGLAEDDAVMAIIDLRDGSAEHDDPASIDVRDSRVSASDTGDQAIVLLAQYGLPLAALV